VVELDQDVDNPYRFHLQAMHSSWAAVDRVDRRITPDEHAVWSVLLTFHIGRDSPSPKRHLGIQHWIPEEFGDVATETGGNAVSFQETANSRKLSFAWTKVLERS
jgi:hypothetical protein